MSDLCCGLFHEMLNSAGQKGFSVVPKLNEMGKVIIFLQGRNQDLGWNEGTLTVMQRAIMYCPFCGSKLSDVVGRNREFMTGLAEKNQSFII